MSDNIVFSKLDETGGVTEVRVLTLDTISKCPTLVFLPDHYREDGTCRHDEPNCEEDNCTNLKYEEEIFCEQHCY